MSERTKAFEELFAEEARLREWKKGLQRTLDELTHELIAYSLRLDKHTADADEHLNAIHKMLNGRDLPRPA